MLPATFLLASDWDCGCDWDCDDDFGARDCDFGDCGECDHVEAGLSTSTVTLAVTLCVPPSFPACVTHGARRCCCSAAAVGHRSLSRRWMLSGACPPRGARTHASRASAHVRLVNLARMRSHAAVARTHARPWTACMHNPHRRIHARALTAGAVTCAANWRGRHKRTRGDARRCSARGDAWRCSAG